MHLKLAVVAREVIILGSYNWTRLAERRNKEILEIRRSPEYAERLIGEIEGIRSQQQRSGVRGFDCSGVRGQAREGGNK